MSGSEYRTPRFLSVGDRALCVEFGDEIDAAINDRVVALEAALQAGPPHGLIETVPTYRSLLVVFDPDETSRAAMEAAISAKLSASGASQGVRRRWRIPVAYGGTHGCDLETVAAVHDLTPEEVIALHTGVDLRVYMIGFAPGFSYLGGLPEALHTSRRSDPRTRTPPRSISIGGKQAAISTPLPVPSGWHLLGQTPVRSYAPERRDQPFLFEAGDLVRFHQVSATEYEALLRASEAGEEIVSPQTVSDSDIAAGTASGGRHG